jgi:hypothetical protein
MLLLHCLLLCCCGDGYLPGHPAQDRSIGSAVDAPAILQVMSCLAGSVGKICVPVAMVASE